jgi:hypothetical protein
MLTFLQYIRENSSREEWKKQSREQRVVSRYINPVSSLSKEGDVLHHVSELMKIRPGMKIDELKDNLRNRGVSVKNHEEISRLHAIMQKTEQQRLGRE